MSVEFTMKFYRNSARIAHEISTKIPPKFPLNLHRNSAEILLAPFHAPFHSPCPPPFHSPFHLLFTTFSEIKMVMCHTKYLGLRTEQANTESENFQNDLRQQCYSRVVYRRYINSNINQSENKSQQGKRHMVRHPGTRFTPSGRKERNSIIRSNAVNHIT